MHGGDIGVDRVGDQRNARCPEARIFARAGYLFAELRRELAEDGGGVNPHFLEDASFHHGHATAAAGAFLAQPVLGDEPACRTIRQRTRQFVLYRLEGGADRVAKAFEPSLCRCLLVFDVGRQALWQLRSFHGDALPFADFPTENRRFDVAATVHIFSCLATVPRRQRQSTAIKASAEDRDK